MKVLVDYRAANNLTQSDVAKILDVSQPLIVAWENGTRFPRRKQLIALAEMMKVPLEYIVCENQYTASLERICSR